MEWWRGTQIADAGDPSAEYARHLSTIRDLLPSDLLVLQESISLHDSRLRGLMMRPALARLRLRLESYAADERFDLEYSGVESLESTADPRVGLNGPHGYGDLGYDEVGVLSNGAFEHRILFSSGIELAIAFRGFEFRRGGFA